MNNRIKGHDPITVVMGNQPLVTHAAKVASDPTSTDAVVCASVRNPRERYRIFYNRSGFERGLGPPQSR